MENHEEGSKVLAPDYRGPEEYSVELNTNEEDNPRLKVDVPANKLFYEITQTNPPFLVLVVRADRELMGIGLLEKAKVLLMSFQATLNKKVDLTKGVRQIGEILKQGGLPRA